MFQELNRRGAAYPVWVYKPHKIDGRKKKIYRTKEGTVFNELGRIGKVVLSTKVQSIRKEGWKPLDELLTPVIESEPKKVIDIITEGAREVVEKRGSEMLAEKLLKGEGLNFSSFIRAHGKNHKDQKVKKDLRPAYDKVLKEYEGKAYKQGHDWFLKDK